MTVHGRARSLPGPASSGNRAGEKFRADLIEAAGASGRPVSEEIEMRLEQSFHDERGVGGAHNAKVGRLIAQTLSLLDESLLGSDKELINSARRAAVLRTVEIHFGKGPGLLAPYEEHELERRTRDIGEMAAEIVARQDADEIMNSRANVVSDMPIPTLLSVPFTHRTNTTKALGVIAGALAGLVALLVYLGTKEKVAVPSLNKKPEPSSSILPNSINVQDLRAVETRQLPQSPEGINVAVSATVEKNGNERVQCEAELLVNQHIIHQKYIHYWGYKTEAALMLPEGIARNEIWAYFAVPDDPYSQNAAFRFDCNELSTAWLPISLRRGPPIERKK